MRHRCSAEQDDSGWVVKCTCGWSKRYVFGNSAKREAAVHRRHGIDSDELARRRVAEVRHAE